MSIRSKVSRLVANAVLKSAGSPGLYSPPGHYYSPIINPAEAMRYVSGLGKQPFPVINNDMLFLTLDRLSPHFPRCGEVLRNGRRYVASNELFRLGEAYIYAAFIADLKPKTIIEVGSGYSSACALDMVDAFNLDTQLIFIEPYPERLYSLISDADQMRVRIFETGVQEVSLSVFDQLEAGDILFLDTTHICKTGSDVAHELFQVLPNLKPGVILHFHDIFDGWEYPVQWIDEARSWNEIYVLRAYLMFNQAFEIIYFNDFMWRNFKDRIDQTALVSVNDGGFASGSGLYLRRV